MEATGVGSTRGPALRGREHGRIEPMTSAPPSASDGAFRSRRTKSLALSLLQICADPVAQQKPGSMSLARQLAALRTAIDEHAAAKKSADDAAAALAGVQAQAATVAEREAALVSAQRRLDVASGAIAERDAAVKAKEEASDKRAAEI